MNRKKSAVVIALALTLGLLTQSALAAYPEKPITWIVPWPAGGRTDIVSRIFASVLEKTVGQPVLVVNKPGAGGVLGAKELAAANPDGYTLSQFSTAVVLTQYIVPTPTNLKDYIPVARLFAFPALLSVHSKSPWSTMKEFLEYARANPEKLKNAHAGVGSSDHMVGASFQKAAGVKFIQVPYTGDAPAVAALAGRHVDCNFAPMAAVKAFVTAGDLRVLGVSSEKRRSLYPHIPTWKEQGVNVNLAPIEGIFLPAGTPANIVSVLEKALVKVSQDAEVISKMNNLGVELEFENHKDFIKKVAETDAAVRQLVDELGLRVPPR
jgi:tripartite-type tricarboxylate transporter receptor subunit TctC